MKTVYLLPLLLLLLNVSCKKDKAESIDYNVLTEQRMLEVSEQATISAEDIASLQRLLEKVPNNATKEKLTGWMQSITLISEFIPSLADLRTNPELDFQLEYDKLMAKLNQVTDQLPRKSKLLKEMEDAKANFSLEEYEYSDDIFQQLTPFLKENFDMDPVPGKTNRFRRMDIEKVDSLVLFRITNTVIKTFKALKYLNTNTTEELADLNHLVNLESLTIGYPKQLKIDNCTQLKRLTVRAFPEGNTVLDLTNNTPLLEYLEVSTGGFSNSIKELIVPNKGNLKEIMMSGTFNKLTKIILEGNGSTEITGYHTYGVLEIPEARFKGLRSLGLFSNLQAPHYTKFKKLEIDLPQGEILGFANVEIPADQTLGDLPKIKHIQIAGAKKAGEQEPEFFEAWLPVINKCNGETLENIEFLNLTTYPNKTADLSKFKKLNMFTLTVTNLSGVQVLDKVIINKTVANAGYEFYQVSPPDYENRNVTIETKD